MLKNFSYFSDITPTLKKILSLVFLFCFLLLEPACISLDQISASNTITKKDELLLAELRLVKLHLDQGDPSTAWSFLRPLTKIHADSSKVLNLAGITHLSLRNHKEALKYFEAAYKIDKDPAAALNISSTLIALGQYHKARELLIALLDKDSGYPFKERILHNIGLSLHRQGKLKIAQKYYNRALVENPSYYLSAFQLARIYQKLRKKNLAIKQFKSAIALCKSCFEPVKVLASIYLKEGYQKQAEKVVQDYLKLKEISPIDEKSAHKLLALAQKAKKPV